jgi:DNA-binding CsgD family transcriptional regulator
MHLDVNVRDDLERIGVPTLILHRTDDFLVPVTCARYMAEKIPQSRYVELAGSDHMYWLGNQDETLHHIRHFLRGIPEGESLSAHRRRRPSSGWEALTDAEMDIVRLLGSGMTNKQIAGRLYISSRTVQTHLSHIATKLGVSRRSEVAAEAARRGL